MNFLSYLYILIISFLGPFIGFILILIAPEEKKPGEKYFRLLGYIFLCLISAVLIYYNFSIIAILITIFLALSEWAYKNKEIKYYITPIILAIIFYLSSKNISMFIIESILIFFYNVSIGSLVSDQKRKKESIIRLISYNIAFLIIGIVIFLILS